MRHIPIQRITLVREGTLSTPSRLADSAEAVVEIVRDLIGHADREHFIVLQLDTRNQVTGVHVVSVGHLNACLIHPREVFKASILANANAIIIVHNHPSGNPEPSMQDEETTRRLIEAGDLLGIPVLDHIVIGELGFVSMKQRGLI